MSKTIYIHTDGSSNKEKTTCGWAFCISTEQKEINSIIAEDSGRLRGTHNVGELSAVLHALQYVYANLDLKEYAKVIVFTDSQYVSEPIYFNSLKIWEANNWRTNAGDPVKNLEIWQEMKHTLKLFAFRRADVEVRWVRGHNGNPLNEHVDRLAVEARKNGVKNILYGGVPMG